MADYHEIRRRVELEGFRLTEEEDGYRVRTMDGRALTDVLCLEELAAWLGDDEELIGGFISFD